MTSSFFSDAKKLSIGALSRHSPLRLMDWVSECPRRADRVFVGFFAGSGMNEKVMHHNCYLLMLICY
jgi:hypothetical protein